jgi:hypothetical protein
LSSADNQASLAPHVTLPAGCLKVVRAVHFQYDTSAVFELPLGVEVTQPTLRVMAPHLAIRHLNAIAAADSNQVNIA